MNERETSKRPPENGDPAEEIEIIDVTELLEDTSDVSEADLTTDSMADLPEVQSMEADKEEQMGVDDIFRILEDDADDEDEEIIDLVDVAGGDENSAAEHLDGWNDASDDNFDMGEVAAKTPEIDTDLEDDFIAAFDLEEILGDAPHALDGLNLQEDAPESDGDMDFIDGLDLDLGEDVDEPIQGLENISTVALKPTLSPHLQADSPGGVREAGPAEAVRDVHLTEQQVDAAVERVIRKMYAEKIDAILVEAIEKTVNEEIDRLKNLLNQGSPDL